LRGGKTLLAARGLLLSARTRCGKYNGANKGYEGTLGGRGYVLPPAEESTRLSKYPLRKQRADGQNWAKKKEGRSGALHWHLLFMTVSDHALDIRMGGALSVAGGLQDAKGRIIDNIVSRSQKTTTYY